MSLKLFPIVVFVCFSVVFGQDFDISVSPVIAQARYQSVVYDETRQFVYLSGFSYGNIDNQTIKGNADAVVVKSYTNGTRVWTRFFGGPGEDVAQKAILDSNGLNLLVFGRTAGTFEEVNNTGSNDAFYMILAPNGTKLLTKIYATANYDAFTDALLFQGNQVVLAGALDNLIAVAIIDQNNGTMLKKFQMPAGGYGQSVAVSGNVAFFSANIQTSFDGEPNVGTDCMALIKLDLNTGNRTWSRFYGAIGSRLYSSRLTYDPQSQLIFQAATGIGPVLGFQSPGLNDAYLLCTHSNGSLMWKYQLATGAYEGGYGVSIHKPTGQVYFTGDTWGNFPGKTVNSNNTQSGFVLMFAQNGTLLKSKFQYMARGAQYRDLAFSSSGSVGFVADYGGGSLVSVNVSGFSVPSAVPTSTLLTKTTTSTVVPKTTTTPSTGTSSDTLVFGFKLQTVLIGAGAAALLLLLICVVCCWCFVVRRRRQRENNWGFNETKLQQM